MRSSLLAVVVLGAAACDHPADPSEVHDRINALVPEIVDATNAAGDGADPVFGALGNGLSLLDRFAPAVLPELGVDATFKVAAPSGGGAVIGEDGATGADVARSLNEGLFADANYEGDGVFRVPVTELCADPTDTACVDDASRAELRVRAETADDGLDFTLLVGADRAEPLAIGLRRRAVTMSVDLGEAELAVRDIGATVSDGPAWTVELSGVISARLDVLGTAHVAVAVNIDQPVHVTIGDGTSEPMQLDTAEAQPLVRVELDGAAVTGSAQLGLGSTQVHIPADADPALDVDLAGLTATARMHDGALTIDGLSLGDRTTTVAVGGQQAIAIDLNRDAGRALDMTVTGDDTDATFAVSPGLDLQVAIDHAVLGDESPRYDITRVLLWGGSPSTVRQTVDASTGVEQLMVMAGTLTLDTNPAGYGVVVDGGQCLGEESRSDAAGSYTAYVATACQ